jgi:hypothetical protein
VAANVAIGGTDSLGRIVAGWPAFALLVAIKLMSGLLEARPNVRDVHPASAVRGHTFLIAEMKSQVTDSAVPESRLAGPEV